MLFESLARITNLLLSGTSRVAFLTTAGNRLLSENDFGDEEPYRPLPSRLVRTTSGAKPGSHFRLSGVPFSDGMRFTAKCREFPVIALTADTFEVQIPWEFDRARSGTYTSTSPGFSYRALDVFPKRDKRQPFTLTPLGGTQEWLMRIFAPSSRPMIRPRPGLQSTFG